MAWDIVPGRPEDAAAAAGLLTDTDDRLFRLFGGGDIGLWTEIARHEWAAERGIYCHDMSHVIRGDDGLIGLILGYAPRRGALIDWSLAASRPHVDPARMEQLDRVRRLATFLFPAIPDDAYYVQNVAVRPEAQGRGLGRRLLEFALALGRDAGCRSCHLDVDRSTPAVRFYERLGFQVMVQTEVAALPGIPPHLRMVRDL